MIVILSDKDQKIVEESLMLEVNYVISNVKDLYDYFGDLQLATNETYVIIKPCVVSLFTQFPFKFEVLVDHNLDEGYLVGSYFGNVNTVSWKDYLARKRYVSNGTDIQEEEDTE